MAFSRILMVSACCLALAACSSDGSLSFGTSAGGAGSAGGLTAASNVGPAGPAGSQGAIGATGATGTTGATGATGATGTSGSLVGSNGQLGAGLGLTGSAGMINYVLGSDPVGGTVDAALGDNNGVSQLLGSPTAPDQNGLLSNIFLTAMGRSSQPIVNPGLGLTGPNGATTAILGEDAGSALLGTNAPVPASLGGDNTLLGPILGTTNLMSGFGAAVPSRDATNALNNLPQLGVTGANGVSTDLLGIDPVGNLLGIQDGSNPHTLAGGNDGALGNILNGISPATQPVAGGVLSPVVQPAAAQTVLQAGSPTNAVNAVVGAVTGATGGLPAADGVAQTVAGLANTAPTVNTILNTVTGALPAGGGTAATGALGAITQGVTSAIPPASGLGSVLGGLN